MADTAVTSRDWDAVIRDVVAGRWTDPETGQTASVPFQTIHLAEDLSGGEADCIAPLGLGGRLAVVSDENTQEAMGRRVAAALRPLGAVDELVLPRGVVASEETVAAISEKTRHADALVAVGSGTVNDCCKHATFLDGRSYAVFGTAASMNGYAATTASLKLESGMKVSLPSHAPRGVFLDLAVSARSPSRLRASGLGDSLCRPAAQIDWWASHRLLGTRYSATPYALTDPEEPEMLAMAPGLTGGDLVATGALQRVLTLCAMGVAFTGVSNHGSMGEHQVSHWLDMFAGERHPGTLHGEQVGAAAIAIMGLQHWMLSFEEPPEVRPTHIDEESFLRRYGPEVGAQCLAEFRSKAMDAAAAEAFNRRARAIWPELRAELGAMALPLETMREALTAAGGAIDGAGLGLEPDLWREALLRAREIRGRWSFLDFADDAGLLRGYVESLV